MLTSVVREYVLILSLGHNLVLVRELHLGCGHLKKKRNSHLGRNLKSEYGRPDCGRYYGTSPNLPVSRRGRLGRRKVEPLIRETTG